MNPLSLRVLKIFGEMKQERLDLHVLFEAAGNEPAERERVLDAVEELVNVGVLEECARPQFSYFVFRNQMFSRN
jgi:hypothetical protein